MHLVLSSPIVQFLAEVLPFRRQFPVTEGSGISAEEYQRNRRYREGGLVTVHHGEIEDYWYDMGGPRWVLREDGFPHQREYLILTTGDHLTVYNPDGSVRWQGVIDLEYRSGFVPYNDDPTAGAQRVFNRTVNGCQRGVALEQWARMFMRPQDSGEGRKEEFLRGKLLKPAKPDYPD